MPETLQENLLHFISHEVKGWLTKNQAAFAAIAEGDVGPVSEEVKIFAEKALRDTRTGVQALLDILDAANLKKGAIHFSRDKFDLVPIIHSSVESQRRSLRSKKIIFTTDIKESSCIMMGDEAMIKNHVIKNLLDNSVRYTKQGEISVSLRKEKNKILFIVKDTGVGLTEEDKKKLFTEGGRGKNSRKLNAHSTGFGLFIAKQIVDAHKGRIWAESEGEGKGSQFYAEFPL